MPGFPVSTNLCVRNDIKELTKCFKNVGHNLGIRTPLNQTYDLLSLGHLVRVKVEVDNVGDNFREKCRSRYNRRKKTVS